MLRFVPEAEWLNASMRSSWLSTATKPWPCSPTLGEGKGSTCRHTLSGKPDGPPHRPIPPATPQEMLGQLELPRPGRKSGACGPHLRHEYPPGPGRASGILRDPEPPDRHRSGKGSPQTSLRPSGVHPRRCRGAGQKGGNQWGPSYVLLWGLLELWVSRGRCEERPGRGANTLGKAFDHAQRNLRGKGAATAVSARFRTLFITGSFSCMWISRTPHALCGPVVLVKQAGQLAYLRRRDHLGDPLFP